MNAIANAPVYDAATVARLLTVTFKEAELTRFSPPAARDGYVTFFDPGWSILQLRASVADKGRLFFFSQDWYDNEAFAMKGEQLCYRQFRMEAVKDSFRKSFEKQKALVPPHEEIPTARVVLVGMVLHFLATGERLFSAHCVRCADVVSDGRRVVVGDFDSDGFDVHGYWDDDRSGNLGLTSAPKFCTLPS